MLQDNDIADFEVESNNKVYYNIPPLNDKKDVSNNLLPLLEKMGLVKEASTEEDTTTKKSIFDIFKRNK